MNKMLSGVVSITITIIMMMMAATATATATANVLATMMRMTMTMTMIVVDDTGIPTPFAVDGFSLTGTTYPTSSRVMAGRFGGRRRKSILLRHSRSVLDQGDKEEHHGVCGEAEDQEEEEEEATASNFASCTVTDAAAETHLDITIRPVLYEELPDVANLIVECFYAQKDKPKSSATSSIDHTTPTATTSTPTDRTVPTAAKSESTQDKMERRRRRRKNKQAYDIMESNVMFNQLNVLAELNRLQNNFPPRRGQGGEHDHQMYVATTSTTTVGKEPTNQSLDDETESEAIIVGFCDVDCRPYPPPSSTTTETGIEKDSTVLDTEPQNQQPMKSPQIAPPRPYLSDVAVSQRYRRRGIAKALIETAEQFVLLQGNNNEELSKFEQQLLDLLLRQDEESSKSTSESKTTGTSGFQLQVFDDDIIRRDRLYIRVEETNHAALELYHGPIDDDDIDGKAEHEGKGQDQGQEDLVGLGYHIVSKEEIVNGPSFQTREENREQFGSKVVYTLCKNLTTLPLPLLTTSER